MHLANYLRRSLGLDCLSRSYLNWIQTRGESSTIQSVLVGTRLLRGPTFFPENQTTELISVSEDSWWSPFSLRGDSFAGCASSQNHSIFWVGSSLTTHASISTGASWLANTYVAIFMESLKDLYNGTMNGVFGSLCPCWPFITFPLLSFTFFVS